MNPENKPTIIEIMNPENKPTIIEILDAMILLKEDGDKIFARIVGCLQDGRPEDARRALDVIDMLLEARKR